VAPLAWFPGDLPLPARHSVLELPAGTATRHRELRKATSSSSSRLHKPAPLQDAQSQRPEFGFAGSGQLGVAADRAIGRGEIKDRLAGILSHGHQTPVVPQGRQAVFAGVPVTFRLV